MSKKWHAKKDPLYRGDAADGVATPVPGANPSIVRHILYLDGFGRETPYSSTSEERETAERFAQRGGLWKTSVESASTEGIKHIGRTQLLQLLRGKGKGEAKWTNAFEVMQARKYVEQHTEHLLDFTPLDGSTADAITVVARRVFGKA